MVGSIGIEHMDREFIIQSRNRDENPTLIVFNGASDSRFPPYLFDSKGEIVDIDGDYAFVKFYVPTPSIWFKLDQLELAD